MLLFELFDWKTSENGKQSDQINIYLTRMVIGRNQPIQSHNTWKKVGTSFHGVYSRREDGQHGFWFAVQRWGGGGGGGGAEISRRLQIFVPWGLAGMEIQEVT